MKGMPVYQNTYSSVLIVIIDRQNKIRWIDNGFSTITGYLPNECLGENAWELLLGKDTDSNTLRYVQKRVSSGEVFEWETQLSRKNRTPIALRFQGQPMLDEHGDWNQFHIIGTDISEQQNIISRAVYNAQETLKTEISAELHDNVNQLLASVKVYLMHQMMNGQLNAPVLQKCIDHTSDAIQEIRRLTKQISCPISEKINFTDSLSDLRLTIEDYYNIAVKLDIKHFDETKINYECKRNLFRIIQEQLNNITKHAMASFIGIEVKMDEEGIKLTITDDGRGFDIQSQRKGVGMINIFQRAESLNGKAEIVSGSGKGCKLYVVIPLTSSAA